MSSGAPNLRTSASTNTDTSKNDASTDETGNATSSGEASDTAEMCETCDGSLPKFDLADETLDPHDTNSEGMLECTKIDILFAIDTSGSMGDEQEKLFDAFPKFAKSITEELDQIDSIHIGLVSSDENTANDPATCQVTGGLIVQSACKQELAGKRYIDEGDAIASAFACNAAIGQGGHPDNRTMANLTQALTLDGECNAGFLRRRLIGFGDHHRRRGRSRCSGELVPRQSG